MKKVVLGSMMFLAGLLSCAILIAGSALKDITINGGYSFLWNLSSLGLVPVTVLFSAIALTGLLIALWGVFEKNK
ncbi:hypothetical protein [Lacrimispora xylanisolvens]|uniref:hypothetical protein n=1 Tax=Lacrimispora xylanisolvens TaxID=384636 RepID=UPI002402CF83